MSIKLNMLPPSVNNMSVRVFLRAAGLDFTEENAWGQTRSEEYLAKCPAHLTPSIETDDLPNGLLWESCAIMSYLSNKHGLTDFYPTDAGQRAMVDSANFYLIGSLYPVLARAAYPRLGFATYPGEVASSDASDEAKEAARKECEAALPEMINVFRDFFLKDGQFIGGGSKPSIADIRFASTVEFLAVTDYELPSWLGDYMGNVENALGEAYSGPAGDVRGFIASLN